MLGIRVSTRFFGVASRQMRPSRRWGFGFLPVSLRRWVSLWVGRVDMARPPVGPDIATLFVLLSRV
jgi:hypothetical protein